jgi:hypothetical protein
MIALSWADNMLSIRDARLRGGAINVWYLEAFCRDGSTHRGWEETVIPHRTELVESVSRQLRLRSILDDGVVADHVIAASEDEASFHVTLHNATSTPSRAHWAQPCIEVAMFCGIEPRLCDERYLPKCFVFIDGKLERLPTNAWNQEAMYKPGQVWAGPNVDPDDLNPRPVNPLRTSNGLIGCFNQDETMLLATAWWPYQELFQGVRCCIHSDFRIGGLAPGERKEARGKIYLIGNDVTDLLRRYERDCTRFRNEQSLARLRPFESIAAVDWRDAQKGDVI